MINNKYRWAITKEAAAAIVQLELLGVDPDLAFEFVISQTKENEVWALDKGEEDGRADSSSAR